MKSSKFPLLPTLFLDNLNRTVFDLSRKNLVVPVYQRRYKWNWQDVETLLDDVTEKFLENKDFWLGTILLHSNWDEKFIIIDGQQRILTMFLIFKIFLDNFKIDGKIEDENSKYEIYTNENSKNLITLNTIVKFLENKNMVLQDRFNKIKGVIARHKENTEKKYAFQQYIKTKIFCTILILPNSYEYFENINSKATKLTLTEQCIAFLMSEKEEIFEESKNKKLFEWLVSSENKPLKSDVFFERFVDVFAKNKISKFLGFREFIEKKPENVKYFLNFLRETKELVLTEEEGFEITYLKKVCFIDYWVIYVKSRVEENNEFTKYFLKTIWKFDLIRHLNKIAKTSIKGLITSLVREKINKDDYEKVLKRIMIKSDGYFDVGDKKTVLSFQGTSTDIENVNTNIMERLKTFFYILYGKKDEKPTTYFEFTKKLDQIEIDYLCEQGGLEAKRYNFKNAEIERLANLRPWDKTGNNTIKISIEEKLKKSAKIIIWEFQRPGLNEEIEEDRRKAWKQQSESQEEKIRQFWKERTKSLDRRIELIRQDFLTLEVSNFPEENRQEVTKKLKTKWKLEETIELKNLYWDKDRKYVYFGFFQSKGKKTYDQRIQLSLKTLLVLKKKKKEFSSLKIVGYSLVYKKFYEYKCWDKLQEYKGKPSLSFKFHCWSLINLEQ